MMWGPGGFAKEIWGLLIHGEPLFWSNLVDELVID